MTYPYSFVTKNLCIIVLLFFTVIFKTTAQKNIRIWEALLNNNRSQALELVNNLDINNDIESLMLKKIVQMENGMMQSDPEFISKLTAYTNFENYLFANWMLPFTFNDYIENGFDIYTYKAPHLINTSKISNSTVRNGLVYLQAITKRHKKHWSEFNNLINKINIIKDWEFSGVFENLNSSGIDMPYEPEEITSPNVKFNARSKGDASWYKPEMNEVYRFFLNHAEFGSGVHYAQTFIHSSKKQKVHLKLGKGGLIRLWLNDVLIVESDEKHITELDAYTYEVNLQKGVNRILIKSATEGEVPYFILRLEQLDGTPFKNYSVSFKDRSYKKGDINSINPTYIPHNVETFFQKGLQDTNGDVNLNKFCLFQTYSRNGRLNEAIKLLKEWSSSYPNSSLIKSCLAECYTKMGDSNELTKVRNNIKRVDPNYYLSLMLEFENFDELLKLDIDEYEQKLKRIGNSIDYPFMKAATELMITLRQNDREKMKQKLDELLNNKSLPSSIKHTFAEFYSSIFNDDNKCIEKLEEFHKHEHHWQIVKYLAFFYEKQNRIEDAIKLYIEVLEKIDYDNNVHFEIIKLLHNTGQFQRSLKYIEMALENFPNSYLFTKLKGDAYIQINRKNEAIELYKKALSRSPSNKELRAKINDLQKSSNPLKEFHVNDAYEYIRDNRNTITSNNYGVNVLMNQTDLLAYENGGGEYKKTLIYEITSQNGVDIFKEYNLGLSGDYLIKKSELIKPDGETVPADKNGSNLVFDELEVGDVIYVDYERRYIRSGRFYNDQILSHNFEGYHPTLKNVYRYLTNESKVNYSVTNGIVNYKKYNKGDLYVHEWFLDNTSGIPTKENFMPPFSDVITKLHISTVESWSEIASWYSDLVRKQIRYNATVESAFSSIFPKGYSQLTEKERAKRIYYYITENMNYSSVSFRQSGYIPQKPSKTIKTKLGDCKDFSSLFLILAKRAELKTNMVLILTSDYGKNELVLPSSDFNHCIVKVKIDGTDQFLELTDKYLPFGSLPLSLHNASALEIPFDNKEKGASDLIHLESVMRTPAKFSSSYIMELEEGISNININSSVSGHLASYYINIFENEEGDLLEKTVQEEISNRCSEPVKLENILSHDHNKDLSEINFKTKLTTELKVNSVGDISTFKIPYFLNPYNNQIIQNDSRSYPIDYKKYENTDSYKESILIKIKDGQEFVDIPESVDYQFKEHHFSIKYKLLQPNEIKIDILSDINIESISVNEYSEFKEYVKKVLDTRDVILKFSTS